MPPASTSFSSASPASGSASAASAAKRSGRDRPQRGAGCSERIGLRGMPLAQRGKQAVAETAEPRRADRNRGASGAEPVQTRNIGERFDVALR